MPDAFPYDASQWNDSDGDGHGDNPFGKEIGSQQIQTDGRIPIKMATQMRMMPSSMMLHSGMTVMAMDTEMRKVEITRYLSDGSK